MDRDDIQQLVNEALSGLSIDEIRDLTQRLMASRPPAVDQLLAARKPPSRRRPRRPEPVTLRVRADLTGTKPPVWRRLELASDLFLNDVHRIMQAAFGWTDSHLHQFGCGPDYYSSETEYYLCPFSVDDGEDGIPAEQVRLDEVLVDVGDNLFYAYDFGDGWQHVILLEAVLDRDESTPRAVCTAGRRPGPAEDCGGVHGYELLVAATDPTHPDHARARAEYTECFGPDVDPRGWAPTPFDIDQVNRLLADPGAAADESNGLLTDLLDRMDDPNSRRRLAELLTGARLDEPVLIDVDAAVAAVRPYAWLLDRVGEDGIKLTGAGYLPPVHVEAAFTELGFDAEWIGKGNREDMTYPVLDLRESAQRLGLLRKNRGRLLATTRGRALRPDPVGLWWYIAERTPATTRDRYSNDAALLYLVVVAAGVTDGFDGVVAELLAALGWVHRDRTPITPAEAGSAARDVSDILRRMGLLEQEKSMRPWRERPTRGAADFARAALTAWPR